MAPDLLTALRAYLAAEGVVRATVAGGPADTPPLHLEPRDGVPAPGEGTSSHATTVLGAYVTGGIAAKRYESWQRRVIVDLRYRVTSSPLAKASDDEIRHLLVDRRGWTMAGLPVIECLPWRAFQPLGSDSQSFDFATGLLFQLYDGDGATNP